MPVSQIAMLATTAMLFLSASCAVEQQESKRTTGDKIYVAGSEAIILEDQGLELTATAMRGSGSFIFSSALRQIKADQAFSMTLAIEEGGYAEFRAFTFNRLNKGLALRFSRKEGSAFVEYGDGDSWDAPQNLSVDLSSPFEITVDMRNATAQSSVAVFRGLKPTRQIEELLFQSPTEPARKGYGSYYGYVLNRSDLQYFRKD